jgi:magnesium transporter
MKFAFRRSRQAAPTLRDLAHSRPDEAEEYLDTHHTEWEELAEQTPHDAADILEAIDEEGAAELLADLDTIEAAADVLDEMRPEAAADVLEELTAEAAARLIEEMETDQAADLLGALEAEQREAIIEALADEATAEVMELLAHPPDSAGGMMTTEIASLPIGMTAGEAVEALRRFHERLGSNLSYVYVVDDEQKLLGVVSFRDLFFARPGVGIDEVMVGDPVKVNVATDREVVSELVQRYRLLAIPVVNDAGVLVGMVRFDEAMEAATAEASEDIAVSVGAGAEETVFTPIPISLQRRLPWIIVNLGIGIAIALTVEPFRETIEEVPVLAALMPMVALLGGNSGAQSLAVVIRAMAVGELPPGRAGRAIRREFLVGAANGLVVSVLAAVAGGAVAGDAVVGVVIFIAVLANLLVAGVAGSGIPVLLRRLGLDPALASNIFLTMITDLVGFGGFLLTASILL